jgi:hypothetical protein
LPVKEAVAARVARLAQLQLAVVTRSLLTTQTVVATEQPALAPLVVTQWVLRAAVAVVALARLTFLKLLAAPATQASFISETQEQQLPGRPVLLLAMEPQVPLDRSTTLSALPVRPVVAVGQRPHPALVVLVVTLNALPGVAEVEPDDLLVATVATVATATSQFAGGN